MKSSLLVFGITMSFATTSLGQVGLEGFASGRYEVCKNTKMEIKPRKPANDSVESVTTTSQAIAPAATAVTTTTTVVTPTPETKVEPVTPVAEAPPAEPTISEQAESLFSSKAEKIYEFYRAQVHPDDVRNNRLEIEVMPMFSYVDSKSNYSYRTYNSLFNALNFKTNIWFTPSIGVTGQMLFSFAADMDSLSGPSRIPTKYEAVDFGINLRNYFGVSRLSNSVQFSLLYTDNKVNVDSENTSRARLKTNGLGVGLKARVPMSETYAWTFGGSFFPRLQHSESETGIDIKSGSSDENIRFGLDFGGEFKFSRQNQVIWSLGLSTERNTFDGTASLPDPQTAVTPENVSVTNSVYMFSLGYRWGH